MFEGEEVAVVEAMKLQNSLVMGKTGIVSTIETCVLFSRKERNYITFWALHICDCYLVIVNLRYTLNALCLYLNEMFASYRNLRKLVRWKVHKNVQKHIAFLTNTEPLLNLWPCCMTVIFFRSRWRRFMLSQAKTWMKMISSLN